MKLIGALIVCLQALIVVQAQNWPSFRGNNASGVVEGRTAPTTWTIDKGQNVVWKTAIPGFSHSSPIIWENRVFVLTAISSDANANFIAKDRGIDLANDDVKHTWRIYCLDKKSGQVVWSQTAYEGIPRAKRHVKATQANSTPVTDGKYVVALFGSEGLNCYDLNGKLLWKKDLGILNPGLWEDPTSSWGHASSPIIYNDLVIVQADGHKRGYPAGRPMYAFRPGATGDISLKPGQETNDFLAWRSSKGSPYTPTPIIYGDLLYVCGDNGVLTAYDAKTGTMIYQERLPSSFSASPVATDGKLYLSSEDGDVFVVRAGRKFELLARNAMDQPLMATPAISDGLLILRTKDFVYAIGERG